MPIAAKPPHSEVKDATVSTKSARPKPTNTECAILFFLNIFLIYSAVNMWCNIDAYDGNTGQQSLASTCWKMVAAFYILIGVAPVGFAASDTIKSMRKQGVFAGASKELDTSTPLRKPKSK